MLKLTIDQAKQYIINYQGLDNSANRTGKTGILDYFTRIGSIQYDPLNVVGRNPDLVLQSRIKDYKPVMLKELLYTDRKLIDGWDKMMSIYLIQEWPYFIYLREIREKSRKRVLKHRNCQEALDFTEAAINTIKKEGPKLSTQIDFGKTKKGKWGHGRIAGATLDYLFHKGIVGVYKKNGTQKVYDLIQNILPSKIFMQKNPFLIIKDFHKWLILRRISSIGLYWNTNNTVWQGIDKNFKTKSYREILIEELVEDNLLEEVEIEGFKSRFYIRSNFPFKEQNNENQSVRFLAPLDNLLWDRNFIFKMFNFEYRWEVYTPVQQRKYGYYVLPILYGENFIGRFEPVIDKSSNELVIMNLWLEKGINITTKVRAALRKALLKFTEYLGVKGYRDKSNSGI